MNTTLNMKKSLIFLIFLITVNFAINKTLSRKFDNFLEDSENESM